MLEKQCHALGEIRRLPFKPRFSLINQCYDPVIYRNENIFYFIPLAGGGGVLFREDLHLRWACELHGQCRVVADWGASSSVLSGGSQTFFSSCPSLVFRGPLRFHAVFRLQKYEVAFKGVARLLTRM